jgi:beta-lactamase regulating signal transducer with metallopeptidase domain
MSGIELWVASRLVDLSVKAALLALAAGAGMDACRVRSSTVRHRVWFLVLVGMLLFPALVDLAPGVSLPRWLYPSLQLTPVTSETDAGPTSASTQQPAPDGLNVPAASGPRPDLPLGELSSATHAGGAVTHGAAGQRLRDAAAIPLPTLPASAVPSAAPGAAGSSGLALAIVGVYLAGVALLMVRLLIGILRAYKLVRRVSPIDLPWNVTWLETRTRIVESDEVRVPVTIGYWRPVVVLPPDWKTWSDSSLAMVLAHETEHVRRRDTWIALLAAVNCAVHWFHPVAWFVRRRLTDLAEQICDDVVIRVTGSRNEYAQNLLDMVGRLTAGSGRVRPAGVAMARKANVVKRIEAILDSDRPLSRRIGAARALLLVCIVAPLAILTVGLRAATPTVAAPAPAADVVQGDSQADPLPAQSVVRLGTARYRYGSRIESMAVSDDGRLAVVSSGVAWFSGLFWPARVFDLTDGRCLRPLPNERGSSAEAVGLSPDGKTLAIKGGEFLYFRDAATGRELRKLKYVPDSGGGRAGTDWLTFTPDGKQAAVTLMGDSVQLIDVETGKVVRTFAPGGAASACVFSPNGKWMATAGYELVKGAYFARLWEVGTGRELRRFPAARFPSGNGLKRALAFSPDGATLAGGGWGDARLRLWETVTGKELMSFLKSERTS